MSEAPLVLVVDDEPAALSQICDAVQAAGYRARAASSGPEALGQLDGVQLVLAALNMPDMDGAQLLEALRAAGCEVPVAVMSGVGTLPAALAAMHAGAFDYVLKPCHAEEVALKVALGLRLVAGPAPASEALRGELEAARGELAVANMKLAAANGELARMSVLDPLTLLANRRRFLARLDEAAAEAARYGQPLSLVMIDIDGLRAINDRFGLPAGDRVLEAIGQGIGQRARKSDLAARVGGQAFALLLPSTPLEGARTAAENLRARLAELEHAEVGPVTVSLGVAQLGDGAEVSALAERLVEDAEAGVAAAKRLGRDRVELAPAPAG